MMDQRTSHITSQLRASYVVSIVAGLALFQGIQLLLRAASLPLETLMAKLINAILVRGWRNILLLNEPHYPLLMVGESVLIGVIFIAIGLWAGNSLARKRGN